MKNLLRATLLSILLFLTLVFLGVKYHWVTYLQDEKKEQETTFVLPENSTLVDSASQTSVLDEDFRPTLIQNVNNDSMLENMTKQQIIKACEILADHTKKDLLQKELFIGNCVVSNYNETIQDLVIEPSNKNSLPVLQAKKLCLKQLSNGNNVGTLELELLTGICASNRLNW